MNVTARVRRPTTLLAAGVFLLALIVYGLTLAPTLSFWDCGEYIATSHILGIPHSPGTPMYVLMGRVFDLLLSPFVSTAVALNAMSAFFSALAVMFAYLIILNVARRNDRDSGWLAQAGALSGAFFLMLSYTFWNNAIEAEVYGLSAFIISFLTWLALKWYDTREFRSSQAVLYLIIYLLGLGVGFHMGALLVYPGIFLMILLADRKRFDVIDLFGMSFALALFMLSTMVKDDYVLLGAFAVLLIVGIVRSAMGRHVILISTGVFALGISVHLFMLIRAGLEPAVNQWQPEHFKTLMSVLRREQYPPINPFERKADLAWQIKYYYDFLLRQFTWLDVKSLRWEQISVLGIPVFLAFLGAAHSLWRTPKIAAMLVANYFINGEILNLYLNFSDHEVRERDYFFSAGFLFFALFIGLGAAALTRYLAGPLGRKFKGMRESAVVPIKLTKPAMLVAVLLLVIPLSPIFVPGHTKWFEHDRSRNTMAREYAWNMIAGLDENAIIFTNGDNDTFPVWYLQVVEGFRPDVTVINLSLANLPWYIKQLTRQQPALDLELTPTEIDSLGLATRYVPRRELIDRWGKYWGRNFASTLEGLTVLDKTGLVITRAARPQRQAGGKLGQSQAERLMQLLIAQREKGLFLTGRTHDQGKEFEVVATTTTVSQEALSQYARIQMAPLPPERKIKHMALLIERLGSLSDAGIILTRVDSKLLSDACVTALGESEMKRLDHAFAVLRNAGYPLTGRVLPDGKTLELKGSPVGVDFQTIEGAAERLGLAHIDLLLSILTTLSQQNVAYGRLASSEIGPVQQFLGGTATNQMLDDFVKLQDAKIYLTGWVSADRSRVGVGQLFKDRVIERVIAVNKGKRPIFFAATIPFDNIWIDHLSRLRMEGLAYRLTDERSHDGYPAVDAERLIANVFGIYDFTALLDGDYAAARRRFRELNGVPATADLLTATADFASGDWDATDVWRDFGHFRRDVHYSPNGRNLKGNYPLGLLRASQVFLNQAQAIPEQNTVAYERVIAKVESCLELTRRLQSRDNTLDQLAYYYPMVLAHRKRGREAIAYLDEVAPRLPSQQAWEVVEQLAMALASEGETELADAWLNRRIDEHPDDPATYYLAFKVQSSLADLEGCKSVQKRWRAQFGSPDTEMAKAIAEMEARRKPNSEPAPVAPGADD